jgi:hypothetical protein
MKSVTLRFWLLAALFAAWIGFLLYLALSTRNPVILSRPQVLASSLDIVGRVDDPDSALVTVVKVLWPPDQKGIEGQKITVTNLPACKKEGAEPDGRTTNERWTGPDEYILPLARDGQGGYQVATPKRSPGFDPARFKPHIYPATKEARDQLEEIRQPH